MAPIGLRIFYQTSGIETKNVLLFQTDELSAYNWLTKSTVREAINFGCDLVAGRVLEEQRISIEHSSNLIYAYRSQNLIVTFACDETYQDRVANRLLSEFHALFSRKYPSSTWPNLAQNGQTVACEEIIELFKKSKNPLEVDKMERMRQDLNDTCDIMHKNIDSILQRGERLDDLVNRSQHLSEQSKQFYKTAKQTNSCCTLL